MLNIHLLCAFFSVLYGAVISIRKKMPLFYKILLYGFSCNLLGVVYIFCYKLTFGAEPQGLNIGLLGYLGMHFFLISSYVGAIDRLADGGEKCYRNYRLAALLPSIGLLVNFIIQMQSSSSLRIYSTVMLVPAMITVYFACKHLILPDVDMGIIKAMRPYNALILVFCYSENVGKTLQIYGYTATSETAEILSYIVLALMLFAAYKGVRKWFM